MHIVHINTEKGYSGGEEQMFMLMKELRALGVSNELVAAKGSASIRTAEELGFEVYPARMRNNLDWRAVASVAKHLRAANHSPAECVVHAHTGRAAWLGGWMARKAGLAAIATRRMDREVKRSLRNRLINERLLAAHVAISPAVKTLMEAAGAPPEKTPLIWDAVDPASLQSKTARSAIRSALEVPAGTTVVLALSALVHRKGLDVLMDALAQMHFEGDAPLVLIAGTGKEREALLDQRQKLADPDQVRFLGWRDDKADLLHAADLFVMPSRREGCGVAALEAMAVGLCVVASNVGGLGEAVLDGVTGFTAPPGDAAALARALEQALADPERRQAMGQAGKQRIADVFDASKQAQHYLELYEQVLATHQGQGSKRPKAPV